MTDHDENVENQTQVVSTAIPETSVSDNRVEPTAQRPHLQVFGPDTGVFESPLPEGSITIGRSEHADIKLPHHTVSRIHATISFSNGEYVLEDANSNSGTTVNRNRVESHVLKHGDSAQIAVYVLQFRTHSPVPGALAAAAQARLMLRTEFCLLPSTMRLRFRRLKVDPREIFKSGDTLRIGYGGLLIPTSVTKGYASCVELQLYWPTQQSKRYLGEILGIFPAESTDWMCVKLHSVPKEIHKVVVAASEAEQWVDVAQT